MDRKRIYKWEIFLLGSLVLPAPYLVYEVSGTMPLLVFLIGTIYELFVMGPFVIIYAVFFAVNAAILNYIANLLTKRLLKLKPSVFIHGAIVATFVALLFVPWHSTSGINTTETYSIIEFFPEMWEWFFS